jgi:sterol desaturase/sphingolipid hydroxylase (fatty acid hydroxylase superfamily)
MWQNMFLYSDDWIGTADLFMTEVIPTLIFCYFTGQWWIFAVYYIWTAFIQKWVEHTPKFSVWSFSAEQCHLKHHTNWRTNYSISFPIWDIIFKTYTLVRSKQ